MINSTIKKWGNSLAVRIPRAYADELGFDENANVSLEISDDRLIIRREDTLDDMLAQINDENKHTLADFGEPRGREMI